MNALFGTLCKVVVLSLLMSSLVEQISGFPIILRRRPGTNTTRILKVSSTTEIQIEINKTFPKVLSSNLNPYEYLRQQGHGNVTGLDILPFLFLDQIPARRTRRSVTYQQRTAPQDDSCPVSWVVNMEANRLPVRIQKAICNGPGTSCKSSEGLPSCEEVKFPFTVSRFLGMDSKGKQIWQTQEQLIPVACTCAGAL